MPDKKPRPRNTKWETQVLNLLLGIQSDLTDLKIAREDAPAPPIAMGSEHFQAVLVEKQPDPPAPETGCDVCDNKPMSPDMSKIRLCDYHQSLMFPGSQIGKVAQVLVPDEEPMGVPVWQKQMGES